MDSIRKERHLNFNYTSLYWSRVKLNWKAHWRHLALYTRSPNPVHLRMEEVEDLTPGFTLTRLTQVTGSPSPDIYDQIF